MNEPKDLVLVTGRLHRLSYAIVSRGQTTGKSSPPKNKTSNLNRGRHSTSSLVSLCENLSRCIVRHCCGASGSVPKVRKFFPVIGLSPSWWSIIFCSSRCLPPVWGDRPHPGKRASTLPLRVAGVRIRTVLRSRRASSVHRYQRIHFARFSSFRPTARIG